MNNSSSSASRALSTSSFSSSSSSVTSSTSSNNSVITISSTVSIVTISSDETEQSIIFFPPQANHFQMQKSNVSIRLIEGGAKDQNRQVIVISCLFIKQIYIQLNWNTTKSQNRENPTDYMILKYIAGGVYSLCIQKNYNIENIGMGQTQSVEHKSSFLNELTFIEATEDKHFGFIDIYRTRQAPYEYVMDFKKNFIEDNERMAKYMRLISQIKNMEHKNLAKIHHCEVIQENQMCIKHKKIHTFCNYYNFTLESAIEKKKLQDTFFPQTELVYIMGCLLEVARFLEKYGISVGQYRSKSIFLSPQGYVKLFLLEIDDENKHSCYYKVLSQRNLTEDYIFSPQQLYCLNNMDFDIKYNIFKADVFAIGMVILQLITLDKPKFYYNQTKTELKIDRISFDISSMSKNYSQDFINLLKFCLNPNPSNRATLDEANEELNRIRKGMKNVTYCIRLQQDEEKAKKNLGKREIAMSAKGQHILNGLQKKLTPSPIATMTSSTSSSFKVETKNNSSRTIQTLSIKL